MTVLCAEATTIHGAKCLSFLFRNLVAHPIAGVLWLVGFDKIAGCVLSRAESRGDDDMFWKLHAELAETAKKMEDAKRSIEGCVTDRRVGCAVLA